LEREKVKYELPPSDAVAWSWEEEKKFMALYDPTRAAVSITRAFFLWKILKSVLNRGVPGEVWEMGVYQGGSAKLLKHLAVAALREIRLFDTFSGMPDPIQTPGWDFTNTSLQRVKDFVGEDGVSFHPGVIPQTFDGLEQKRICFAHVDLDTGIATASALRFIRPRMNLGGAIVLDDYCYEKCRDAKYESDMFCAREGLTLIPMIQGSALILF
jgi:hypothetical protein